MPLELLRLLQLADSAAPIGGAAHSFGLESLAAEERLGVADLGAFFSHFLRESGMVDAVFCRASHRASAVRSELDELLSAMRPARESRVASQTLGRRFLHLARALVEDVAAREAHYAIAFGAVAGMLRIEEDAAVLGFLHQSAAGLISACQRLMPLGQLRASQILWDLKPVIVEVAEKSRGVGVDEVCCFAPLLEIASMRHVGLETRLFIS